LKAISEDMAKQLDPEIELKRAMSEQAAWGGQPPAAGSAAAAAVAAAGESKAAEGPNKVSPENVSGRGWRGGSRGMLVQGERHRGQAR
jgi:hypothetical protein